MKKALTNLITQHKVLTSNNRMAAGRPQMGRRMTHEAIPTVTNYSNLFMLSKKNVRPTVEELHESDLNDIVNITIKMLCCNLKKNTMLLFEIYY